LTTWSQGGANARTLTHNINTTSNRLTSITGGPAAFNFAYGYDAQGNITRRGTQSYTFDQGNRMTAAAGRASYAYDGLGRRFSTVGTDGSTRSRSTPRTASCCIPVRPEAAERNISTCTSTSSRR
jgi:YD repeat-containing protein